MRDTSCPQPRSESGRQARLLCRLVDDAMTFAPRRTPQSYVQPAGRTAPGNSGVVTLVSLHYPRTNLSPFTKDFRGEEHYNESIDLFFVSCYRGTKIIKWHFKNPSCSKIFFPWAICWISLWILSLIRCKMSELCNFLFPSAVKFLVSSNIVFCRLSGWVSPKLPQI